MISQPASRQAALRAFLRAELDSPTERERLLGALARSGLEAQLILDDNTTTATLWQMFRVYRGHEAVFDGLDFCSLDWTEVMLTRNMLESNTVTCRNNFERRFGTRRPTAIARQLQEAGVPNGVMAKVRTGVQLEPPLLIADPDFQRLVILEGHNRLLSYLRATPTGVLPVRVFVGTSPSVSTWCQW